MSILQVKSIQTTSGKTILGQDGGIIQTVYVRADDRINYSAINSGNGNTLAPLGLTITPKSIGSRLICHWMINGEVHQDALFVIHRNGVLIDTGDAPGFNALNGNVRWSGIASGFYDTDESTTPSNWVLMYSQLSDSLEPRTYAPAIRSSSSGIYTLGLNRTISGSDAGTDGQERMVSTGVIYEVSQ
jgi:hypothetical protein